MIFQDEKKPILKFLAGLSLQRCLHDKLPPNKKSSVTASVTTDIAGQCSLPRSPHISCPWAPRVLNPCLSDSTAVSSCTMLVWGHSPFWSLPWPTSWLSGLTWTCLIPLHMGPQGSDLCLTLFPAMAEAVTEQNKQEGNHYLWELRRIFMLPHVIRQCFNG